MLAINMMAVAVKAAMSYSRGHSQPFVCCGNIHCDAIDLSLRWWRICVRVGATAVGQR